MLFRSKQLNRMQCNSQMLTHNARRLRKLHRYNLLVAGDHRDSRTTASSTRHTKIQKRNNSGRRSRTFSSNSYQNQADGTTSSESLTPNQTTTGLTTQVKSSQTSILLTRKPIKTLRYQTSIRFLLSTSADPLKSIFARLLCILPSG